MLNTLRSGMTGQIEDLIGGFGIVGGHNDTLLITVRAFGGAHNYLDFSLFSRRDGLVPKGLSASTREHFLDLQNSCARILHLKLM